MIKIDIRDLCLALRDLKTKGTEAQTRNEEGSYFIEFDPQQTSQETTQCPAGDRCVMAEILDDRMLQERGRVGVDCSGCELQHRWRRVVRNLPIR